jgi:hypothetical protein
MDICQWASLQFLLIFMMLKTLALYPRTGYGIPFPRKHMGQYEQTKQ